MAEIKNIVFDLGRVLVDFDHQIFVDYLLQSGAALISEAEFTKLTRLKEFETGGISGEEFIALVLKLLPGRPGLGPEAAARELTERWQKIFTPIEEMFNLARELKPDYRTFVISNTNELHWDYILSEYQLDHAVHGLLALFEAGLMKPDERIFKLAESRFDILPGESVFIDDIEANLSGAKIRGWKTIHHRSPETTIGELRRLGIRIGSIGK